MSHVRPGSLVEKLRGRWSPRRLLGAFARRTMAGQKAFLYNEDLPRVINLSFNERTCMFSCTMCPYSDAPVRDMYRSGSEMSFATLKNIVASVPDDPDYSFDVSAIGETLAFKPLPDFIAYMKRERPSVNTIVSTNGVMLTEDVFRALVESGLDSLQISLFAENEADHELITKSRSFHRVCDNIRSAARLKRELGASKPYIQTFMMEAEETRHLVAQFVEYWSQHADHAFSRPLYNLGRQIEELTPLHEPARSAARYPCIQPWYSTAIRSNGDVLPCYMFHWHRETKDVVIGNINETPLAKIWRSDAFRRFRRAHLALDFEEHPICARCDLWDAYTNVWEERGDGTFAYSRIRAMDLMRRAPEHRGG